MHIRRSVALLLLVMSLSVFLGTARAQGTTLDTASTEESDALSIAQKWASLVSNANVAGLDKLLSDDYIHIHGTSLVESKSQFLDALRNGSRKYDPIKIEEAVVRVFGSTAIVIGKFELKALVRGKSIEGINRFGLVLTKTSKGQQIVSFQATPIPQVK